MKRIKFISLGFCLLLNLSAFAQSPTFEYKRSISKPVDQWHKIILPDDIYQEVSNNLSDLRIFGSTSKTDTIEVPFILETKTAYHRTEALQLKVFNKGSKGNQHFFTLECPDLKEINELDLSFEEKNFDWKVQLEGSQDLKEWISISKDNRIVAIKNSEVNYQYSSIVFPDSKYRYYRIMVPNKQAPKLLEAKVYRQFYSAGTFKEFEIAEMTKVDEKESKKTYVDFSLSNKVPISFIQIEVDSQVDYYRKIDLQYLVNTIETPKGKKHVYRTMESGYLSSFENNTFNFPTKSVQQFRLVVYNQDNAPLKIIGATCKGHPTEMIARFDSPADYFLYYGNEKLRSPKYDIASFKNTIPQNLKPLSLGTPLQLAHPENASTEALFTNKIWLYLLMTLIILVLGGYTLKMMKESNGGV